MEAPQDQVEITDVPANWTIGVPPAKIKDFGTGKYVAPEAAHKGVITWVEYSSMDGPGANPGDPNSIRGFRVVVMYRAAPAAEQEKVMWMILGKALPKKPKALSVYQLRWLVSNFDSVIQQMRLCHEHVAQLGAKQTGVPYVHHDLPVYAPSATETSSVEEMDVPVLQNEQGEILPYSEHLQFVKNPLYRDYAIIRGTARFVGTFREEKQGNDSTRIQVVISQKLAPEAWYRTVNVLLRDGATIGKPCGFDLNTAYWFKSVGETLIEQAEAASAQLRTLGICQRNPGLTWDEASKN